jgi:hypothetical protein
MGKAKTIITTVVFLALLFSYESISANIETKRKLIRKLFRRKQKQRKQIQKLFRRKQKPHKR